MQLKKTVKRTGIGLLVLAVIITSLHLFVVYRSRQILNFIVMEASDGQYRVKAKKVRFRYNPLTINASGLQLLPVDTSLAATYYIATADSISLQVTKLWPLLAARNFTLGNVHIIRPLIKVYDTDTTNAIRKPLNLAIADIQRALVTTLSAFNVDDCIIDNAGIAYQQSKKGGRPLLVNHIYLGIKNLHAIKENGDNDTTVNFKADIRLFLNKPFIQLPDTSTDVFVDNLMLDTKKNVFTVNSFNLFERNDNGSIDSINLSNIKLSNFNWPRWLKEGLIEIDSLKAFNGATFFDFSDMEIFTLKDKKKVQNRRPVNVAIILHAVEINKITYGLRTGSPSGPLTIQLNGDSLGISEIALRKDSLRPLQVGNLAFKVTGYTNNYDNNINQSNFDKLIIDHNDLELVNYYRSLNGKRINSESSITIPSLKVNNFSLEDLLQSRLKADNLILNKPKLVIDIQKSEKKRDADATVAGIANSLQPSLDIKHLSIYDASITLLPKQKTAGKVTIENLNTEIDARQLLASQSVMDMISSATALSTSGFRVIGDNINLEVQRSKLNSANNGVYLQRITGSIGQQLKLDLKGVSISDKGNKFDITKLQNIELDNVAVSEGKIIIDVNHFKKQNGNKSKTPDFNIANMNTGPLMVEWTHAGKKLDINNIKLVGTNIVITNGIVSWKTVNVTTGEVHFTSALNTINASYAVVKQPGNISAYNVSFQPLQPSLINSVNIPMVSVQTQVMNTGLTALNADLVTLYKPLVTASKMPKPGEVKAALQLPDFSIKKLLIEQPVFSINLKDRDIEKSFSTARGRIVLQNIKSNSLQQILSVQTLNLQLQNPQLQLSETIHSPADLNLNAHDISFNANTKKLDAYIDTAEVKNLSLHMAGEKVTDITEASAGFTDYTFSNSDSMTLPYLFKHTNWWSRASNITQLSKNFTLNIYNPSATAINSFFSFDSLSLINVLDKDSFWRSTIIEKDYNTLHLGHTELHNWQLSGDQNKRKLTVQYLSADRLNFLTEKDKTHGPDTVSYRPLLANSFKKFPINLSLDTLQLTNGYVKHTLLPEKSKRQATIYFTGINGFLYNIKNVDYKPDDTLRFRLRAQLMGKGDLLVGFKQSYTDSLQAFSMRARMGRMDLSELNQLLVPLVSVKIDHGVADSMLLMVGANDFFAYGSMDLRYRNLRLSLLKKGEKKYFLASFFNFIINAVVHSSNNSKLNLLYQDRLRNKGIYNYWSKIAISGLLSNLGVKRDKKQIKKYNKAIKQRGVPAVSSDL